MIGWQEWVALPELDLVALKAKADTGAKTSALHAENVQFEKVDTETFVTFDVTPSRRRPGLVINVRAPLIDLRDVTSSNGTVERRPVIATILEVGPHRASVDITLTNRSDMTSRMLIGRQALAALGLCVDPSATFLMPKLGYKAYPNWRRSGSALPRRSNAP
ncbi:MAG TPA: RimK/LysX family protein [Hyphomicrobiaceae bacterium]|nr:RimK/LysX family protein [Hyphomicrobiaceae bacterium]